MNTSFVASTDPAAYRAAMTPATKLVFIETPSNPLTELIDIAALAEVAHAGSALLAVDNCFCTPALQRPLEFGADLVIHSATKFLDGQGRVLGGAVLGSDKLVEEVFKFLRTAGPSLSPFNAWVILKGLETLRIRLEAQSANALDAGTLAGEPSRGGACVLSRLAVASAARACTTAATQRRRNRLLRGAGAGASAPGRWWMPRS